MRMLIGATLLLLLALALTTCDGAERLPSQEQVEEAAQEQPAVAEADVTRRGQAESQSSQGGAEVVTRVEPQEEQDTRERTSSDTAERLFDPDAEDLSQLIYWGPDDGFFGVLLPIPSTVQYLLDLLLASGSPAADKYIVDLAAYPNPMREQVMSHLA
ncbi:MAG: hypothetical protein OXH38_13255, partial [Chloroflexi bacterium]|nr:hypothetical protein [Chloroflexota bacterium]